MKWKKNSDFANEVPKKHWMHVPKVCNCPKKLKVFDFDMQKVCNCPKKTQKTKDSSNYHHGTTFVRHLHRDDICFNLWVFWDSYTLSAHENQKLWVFWHSYTLSGHAFNILYIYIYYDICNKIINTYSCWGHSLPLV